GVRRGSAAVDLARHAASRRRGPTPAHEGMIRFVAAVATVLALAGMLVAIAYLAQRRLLFPAPPGPHPAPSGGVEVVRLEMPFGVVEALLLLPLEPSAPQVPLLLFAHGNGELADYWVDEFGP